MDAIGKTRALVGALLLGMGCGQVVADDGARVPTPQPRATVTPPAMAPAPGWLRMVPIPGAANYYLMPRTVMERPVPLPPQYRVPMPLVAPASWAPFVWVLVPAPAPAMAAAAPAVVDYGPVSDTPVMELPPPEESPSAAMPAGASLAPAMEKTGQAANVPSPAPLPAPVEMMADAVAPNPVSQAENAPESVAVPAVATLAAAVVNYGPVAPTPVVKLLALEKRAAAKRSGHAYRAKRKAASSIYRPQPAAAAKSAKKRLCWSNGVVAPCR